MAHIPRCLRGTVFPPRILRPSSVFWDIRLLCFLAALRCAKSTAMAAFPEISGGGGAGDDSRAVASSGGTRRGFAA